MRSSVRPLKDLRLIDEGGRGAGFDLPVTEAVRAMAHNEAVRAMAHNAVRAGWGERDLAAPAASSSSAGEIAVR